LTTQHIEAVLSNPLFAVTPSQRSAVSVASEALKDPIGWFVNEIATGNATLSKVSMCLEMLDRCTAAQTAQLHRGKTPGAIIGDWLRSSGLDSSQEFVEMCIAKPQTKRQSDTFISRLVPLLMADDKKGLLWKWSTRPCTHSFSPSKALLFRQQLLKHMVHFEASQDLYRGLVLFREAYEAIEEQTVKHYERLRPAGQYLVQAIMAKPTDTINQNLYNSFRQSTTHWMSRKWAQAVDAMLFLHHPAAASALPGLQFIQDPAGAATYAKATPSLRRFIVQLSLGVAHQLLEEGSYADAQAVMAFAKQHFPDLVLSSLPTEQKAVVDRRSSRVDKAWKEERNLEILDGLVPT
jgi:hypothetical protein